MYADACAATSRTAPARPCRRRRVRHAGAGEQRGQAPLRLRSEGPAPRRRRWGLQPDRNRSSRRPVRRPADRRGRRTAAPRAPRHSACARRSRRCPATSARAGWDDRSPAQVMSVLSTAENRTFRHPHRRSFFPGRVPDSPSLVGMVSLPRADAMLIKLSDPADMAAAIPHLVGFQPEESLVVVSLRRPRKRIGLTMRFDLPPESCDAELAEQVALRLVGDKAAFALLACCTDATSLHGAHPRAGLIDRIERELDKRDVPMLDALLIRDGRWWSYRCEDAGCCPPDGKEIPAATDIAAAHALLGRGVLPSRSALREQMKPVEFVSRRAMEQAIDVTAITVAKRMQIEKADVVRDETVSLVRKLMKRYVDPTVATVTDEEAARVIVGIVDVHARDRILAQGLDHDLEVVQRLFIDLCRRAIPPDDAPTCTLLAGFAYADGNGGLANVALERALQSDPHYSLANLLRDALYHQVPPSLMRKAWRDAERELTPRASSRQTSKKQKKAVRRH